MRPQGCTDQSLSSPPSIELRKSGPLTNCTREGCPCLCRPAAACDGSADCLEGCHKIWTVSTCCMFPPLFVGYMQSCFSAATGSSPSIVTQQLVSLALVGVPHPHWCAGAFGGYAWPDLGFASYIFLCASLSLVRRGCQKLCRA